MTQTTRRQFLILSAAAATTARLTPAIATRVAQSGGGRRVLTLVYDKGLGMMRAIDRLVP